MSVRIRSIIHQAMLLQAFTKLRCGEGQSEKISKCELQLLEAQSCDWRLIGELRAERLAGNSPRMMSRRDVTRSRAYMLRTLKMCASCARSFAIAALLSFCTGSEKEGTTSSNPTALVGRWVRLREEGVWGDTLLFRADGKVAGSAGHPVPASARWVVRESPLGTRELCVGDSAVGSCQSFRIAGDTLVSGGGPQGPTRFRRIR